MVAWHGTREGPRQWQTNGMPMAHVALYRVVYKVVAETEHGTKEMEFVTEYDSVDDFEDVWALVDADGRLDLLQDPSNTRTLTTQG